MCLERETTVVCLHSIGQIVPCLNKMCVCVCRGGGGGGGGGCCLCLQSVHDCSEHNIQRMYILP